MFNKKLLAASMAAAISTGIAAQTQAMQMQENNIGQVLLAPLYVTADTLTSDIIVVNTRTDAAVKAKIVFREAINSSEVLDFILYLSPGDVWRGSVTGPMNAAVMESTDDSMTDNAGVFGSVDNPIAQPFFDKEVSGVNGYGHFEVIGVYSVTIGTTDVTSPVTGGTVTVRETMDKRDLRAVFNATDSLLKTIGGGTGSAIASSVDPLSLQIMGETQLMLEDNALSNYEIPALGPDTYTPAAGLVIGNPGYDATTGEDSLIGVNMGADGDNITEIEAAIASTQTAFEYNVEDSNVTVPVVSFVTKYRHRGTDTEAGFTPNCTDGSEVGHYSAPFADTVIGEATYTLVSFDNSENSMEESDDQFSGGDELPKLKLPFEVNLLTPKYFSTSGWAAIGWVPREECSYRGMPALNAALKTKGTSFLWTENGDRRNGMNPATPIMP